MVVSCYGYAGTRLEFGSMEKDGGGLEMASASARPVAGASRSETATDKLAQTSINLVHNQNARN